MNSEIGIFLAQLLKIIRKPYSIRQIRLAASMAINPLTGDDWVRAVRFLRSGGYLIEDLAAGTWAKGSELEMPISKLTRERVQIALDFLRNTNNE